MLSFQIMKCLFMFSAYLVGVFFCLTNCLSDHEYLLYSLPSLTFYFQLDTSQLIAIFLTVSGQEKIFERAEKFIRFHEGSTLLHWAASRGHYEIVADLLARGLKVPLTISQ